ncbi:MAG: hypothetical protein HY943_12575 [Gammaproteobacteria bacterium]|nr:hypothetical protein [Gammaproteobacteria bacterium]
MTNLIGGADGETLEILAELRAEKSGAILIVLIDGEGQKLRLRLSADLAREIRDELEDVV